MGSYYRPLVQSIFAPGMVAKVLVVVDVVPDRKPDGDGVMTAPIPVHHLTDVFTGASVTFD